MSTTPFIDHVGTPVSRDQSRNAWRFYNTNAVAMNCARVIKNAVLATGVTSTGIDEVTARHMDVFARNCVDWLMCIGIVPISVCTLDSGQRVPTVPMPHRVELSIHDLPGGDVGYRGVLAGAMPFFDKESRGILVWGGGRYRTATRVFISPLSPFMPRTPHRVPRR
jgi:hypothetical protein